MTLTCDLCTYSGMVTSRKKTPITMALDPKILSAVAAWMEAQELPVTKTWVVETALKEFLEKRNG